MAETAPQITAPQGAPGASAPAKPDPPALAALKEQNAILDQQAAAAQARQKIVAATLPSDVKPLEGAIKVDGDHPIESQIFAWQAINKAAKEIATAIKAKVAQKPQKVILYDESQINLLLGLDAFKEQLELLDTRLQEETAVADTEAKDASAAAKAPVALAAAPLALAPLVASSVIRSAIDLISLFRVDVSIKSKDLTISDLALFSAVSHALIAKEVAVYNGALIPPGLRAKNSAIRASLKRFNEHKEKLDASSRALDLAKGKLKTQITDLTAKITAAKAAQPPHDTAALESNEKIRQTALDRIEAAEERIKATVDAFTSFQTALLKTDDSTGLNPLARILRAEKLDAYAGDAHWLLLKVAAAGGAYRTKHWLWKSEISYSGGAIAHYLLFDPEGLIVASGVHGSYKASGMTEDGVLAEADRNVSP